MKEGASNRGRQAFRLKGTMPALTMLSLLTEDIEAIERQLLDHLSQMPQFFLHAPVVVDLELLGDARIDLLRLADLLRRHHLVPVAVRNASDGQEDRAVQAGWGILRNTAATPKSVAGSSSAGVESNEPAAPGNADVAKSSRAVQERASPPAQHANEKDSAERPLPGLTVRTPVRSGQVIYAPGGDLVVLAAVSSGAELIADGNIHVYAPLRGRALAGAHDNPDASIFCLNLEAEFVSIGGHYLMAEEIPNERRGKPARVHLDHDQLVVTSL